MWCNGGSSIYPLEEKIKNRKTANFDPECDILDCRSTNLVYLLTCNGCSIQYKGETVQPRMGTRIAKHIWCTILENAESDSNCRYVKEHFTVGDCAGKQFAVNIVQKLLGNGRDDNNEISPAVRDERHKREEWWIRESRTGYPYGLNIRVGSKFLNHENSDDNISYNEFNSLPRTSKTKRRGKRNKKSHNSDKYTDRNAEILANELINIAIHNNIPQIHHKARSMIFGLPKKFLRKVLPLFLVKLNNVTDSQKSDVIKDLIRFKCQYKGTKHATKKKIRNPFLTVKFINKGVEMINLPRILHLEKTIRTLPFRSNKDREKNTPVLSYTYTPPIRSKVLNYKDVLKELVLTEGPIEDQIPPCECSSSPYKNLHHGHIITGDLHIIQNSRLRKLLSKGTNYREYSPILWNKVLREVQVALNNFVTKQSEKHSLAVRCFDHYKATIMEEVEHYITRKIKVIYYGRKYAFAQNFTKIKTSLEFYSFSDGPYHKPQRKSEEHLNVGARKIFQGQYLEPII